jgi:hypothetical protein
MDLQLRHDLAGAELEIFRHPVGFLRLRELKGVRGKRRGSK